MKPFKKSFYQQECPYKKNCYYQEGDPIAMAFFGQTVLKCLNPEKCVNLREIEREKDLEKKVRE